MEKRLHAHWYRNQLHVWSDAPHEGTRRPLDHGALHAVIEAFSPGPSPIGAAERSQLGLCLGRPGEPIPTLAFNPADAIDLLMHLSGPCPIQTTPSGMPEPVGSIDLTDSVEYFARLSCFVLECLSSGHFYPDLQRNGEGRLVALWRPLVGSSHEIAQLEAYAAAMPSICHAFVEQDEAHEPGRIVESFVLDTLDALVRRDVSDDAFFSRAEEKAADPAAPPEVRWLAALLGQQNKVDAPIQDQALLTDRVSAWVSQLDEARAAAAWRLCLTLHEPDPDAEDAWPLTFGLQNSDDPAEMLEARALFAEDGAGLLGRNIVSRRVQFTAELARAVEFCPPLERLVDQPAPTDMTLSTVEAHLFIRQWAPVLLAHDMRVFLPDWATHVENALGLFLHVSPRQQDPARDGDSFAKRKESGLGAGSGHLGLHSLMDFDWQVAVGDTRLSQEEFQRLISTNQPLVKFDGRWLQLDTHAADAAARFLEQQSQGSMTLGDAMRTAFGATPGKTGLPVLGVKGTGWVERFLEQSAALRLEDFPQPRSFQGTLRPYQLRGLQWLNFLDQLGIGGCLADDMGLGKTIMLIALLLHEREQHPPDVPPPGPTLLFAPTSVVGNWLREVQRFGPSLRVMVHHGPDRLQDGTFTHHAASHDLVITSYALAHRDVEVLSGVRWHRITLDEAQKIKNPAAAATIAIRSLSAGRHIALTGTPIENHLSELWSIMEMLNPGLLGTAGEFRERFATPIEKLADQQRALQLRNLIRPFVLRRTKTDPQVAGDLPEKMEMKVFCTLTPEQAALYERLTSEMLGRIDAADGIRRRGLILAALTRLKQVCDHPALLAMAQDPDAPAPTVDELMNRSGKVERLLDMLEEIIEAGDSALIFTQYRRMGHLLETILPARLGVQVQFLHGGTPARQRDQMIERFQRPGSDIRIFLLSLRAGGLGLNLTAANHVFHFDRWWNPAVEAQATDRAYRIGQTRKVQVHKFICAGTLEERIDRLLTDKTALADRIVTSGDEWLTNLSTQELREYLSLSRDAVGEFETENP